MKKKVFLGALAALCLVSVTSCATDDLKKENSALQSKVDAANATNSALASQNASAQAVASSALAENSAINSALNEVDSNVAHKVNLVKNNKYEISYVDYLGKKVTKEFDVTSNSSVLDDLKSFTTVNSSSSAYGTSINSINASFSDYNWSIMIYENNASAATGVDGLHVDKGDIFEFKHENWQSSTLYGSYDSYDILVDQAIYNYATGKMQDKIKARTTYADSMYWEDMAINLMANAKVNSYGYDVALSDSSIFSYANASDAYKATVDGATNITGNDNFKYYYAARLLNKDLTTFMGNYSTYINGFKEFPSYGEYNIPFAISAAKTMGLSIPVVLFETSYRASTGYGPDGLSWQLAGIAAYQTVNQSELAPLNLAALDSSYAKDVSLSSYLIPYAAMNVNPRTGSTDFIKTLFDTYFDKTTMQFETEKLGSGDYSSNQIYAALMAYKVQRDTQHATFLFK